MTGKMLTTVLNSSDIHSGFILNNLEGTPKTSPNVYRGATEIILEQAKRDFCQSFKAGKMIFSRHSTNMIFYSVTIPV